MTEAVRTFRISKAAWGRWTDDFQSRHNEQPNKHSWNSREKKVSLLWFCPVAIVHILSVSNTWTTDWGNYCVSLVMSWSQDGDMTVDSLPGLGKVYLFPPTWCEAQKEQKAEEKLVSCIYVKSKNWKAEYHGAWEERIRSLPALSVLKVNEKTLNRSQLTGLLLRVNQMEKELHTKALQTLRAWSQSNYIYLSRVRVEEELHTCAVAALMSWRHIKVCKEPMGTPADHEIYIATIQVYSEMRKELLGFKRNPVLMLMFQWLIKWGHVCWITQLSVWNVNSAAVQAHTVVPSCNFQATADSRAQQQFHIRLVITMAT